VKNKAENELSEGIKFYLYHNAAFSFHLFEKYIKKKVCGLFLTATDFIFESFCGFGLLNFNRAEVRVVAVVGLTMAHESAAWQPRGGFPFDN
jgi:hypothetical protein